MIRDSSDKAAVVDTEYVMFDAQKHPPKLNRLLLCGNIHSGKTVISTWKPEFQFTHWAPLAVFPK